MSVTRLIQRDASISPGEVRVSPEAARHAHVARVGVGEVVEVLDLAGSIGIGELIAWDGRTCVVRVDAVERERGEPPSSLVLALAVLHTEAFSWAVEKATELGATEVLPVFAERVQGRRHTGRTERWQRLAEAAVAQCGRSRPPAITEPIPLAELLAGSGPGVKLVAHPTSAGCPVVEPDRDGITVLVGPEGGFTDGEVCAILDAGFMPLRLGTRVLRAETAAVAALTLAQQLAGWL